jgi:hypothetical protein
VVSSQNDPINLHTLSATEVIGKGFNEKLRDELINGESSGLLLEAKVLTERWRREYNTILNRLVENGGQIVTGGFSGIASGYAFSISGHAGACD